MLRLGSVAGFTAHVRMFASFLYIQNVGVTCLACLMACVVQGPGRYFPNRSSAIVAIPAEGLRHYVTANSPENEKGNDKERRKTKQVLDILKRVHPARSSHPE